MEFIRIIADLTDFQQGSSSSVDASDTTAHIFSLKRLQRPVIHGPEALLEESSHSGDLTDIVHPSLFCDIGKAASQGGKILRCQAVCLKNVIERLDLHLRVPQWSQSYRGIMEQLRDEIPTNATQGRGGELDDRADFFDRCPSLMNRLRRDIVPGKFAESLLEMELCDGLEFLADRFSTPEMKTRFSLLCGC
jgi:hypothetical protein